MPASRGWRSAGHNPRLLLGWVKRRRAEELAAAGLGRLPVRISAPRFREGSAVQPRGGHAHSPGDAHPVRSARGRCAADARQRSPRPSAHRRRGGPRGCCIPHGKRSAAPHFPRSVPRPESGPERPEVPSGAGELRGPVTLQDPHSSRSGPAGHQTPLAGPKRGGQAARRALEIY